MKVECQYERKGSRIKTLAIGEVVNYKTINAAKRESRRLQGASLGAGLVRRIK